MPEGPELCMSSRFVNNVCSGRLFTGRVLKSSVSKCIGVDFASDAYTISSQSRGKELALTLQCTLEPLNKLRLLFRFGMSGRFAFGPQNETPKHAHLQFFSCRPSPRELGGVLSFVDIRRFGSWHVTPVGWGENRGPDPMFDYEAFRSNVLKNLDDSAFNRPICEALLNQKYFNGIGNYLRAEILFRVGVPPFMCARKVLEPLCEERGDSERDILWYCHKLPQEVVNLKHKIGKSETSVITEDDYVAFCQWLKCYENPTMNTVKDRNGRTIWFKGEAGAMCSASQRSKRLRSRRQRAPGGSKHKAEPLGTVTEEMADCKGECGESVELVREEKTRKVVSTAIKQEDGLSLSMVKADEEAGRILVDIPNKLSTTKKRKAKLKEPINQDGPSAKKAKLSVTAAAGGSDEKSNRRVTRKQPLSLPTRRSARIKTAEMRKSAKD